MSNADEPLVLQAFRCRHVGHRDRMLRSVVAAVVRAEADEKHPAALAQLDLTRSVAAAIPGAGHSQVQGLALRACPNEQRVECVARLCLYRDRHDRVTEKQAGE